MWVGIAKGDKAFVHCLGCLLEEPSGYAASRVEKGDVGFVEELVVAIHVFQHVNRGLDWVDVVHCRDAQIGSLEKADQF